MTLDADSLAERRRLKRRLSWWRVTAILGIVIAVGVVGSKSSGNASRFGFLPQVARVSISGMILDDRAQRELLAKLADARQVKAVILNIDSPGGTTTGGEALYVALRKVAEKKPTVAVFGTSATSAAYLAGISADHIVARGNSITGSVGVIFQWPDASDLLKNLGVRVEEVRSGPLKAVPSPFAPVTPEGRKVAEDLVNESRDWFVQLVKERRGLSDDVLTEVKTGRIYTGRQALPIKLIDAIGDEDTARAWLEEKHKVAKTVEIVDWKVAEPYAWYSPRGMAEAAGGFLSSVFQKTAESLVSSYRINNLDGLSSVWHPQQQQ